MTCDRDDADFPSPCARHAVPPEPRAEVAARECENVVLDLLSVPTLPPDADVVAIVMRARRLLREAAAAPR